MTQPEYLEWTPEMVKNFWNYESRFPDNYFTFKRATEIARQIKPFLRHDSRVLDYGCGPGYLAGKLLDSGFQVAGLDFSDETIKSFEQKFVSRPGFLGAYQPEGLRDMRLRFDAITVIEVVEHLYDPQLDELLETVAGLLEPGGVVVFSTPNEENLDKSMILCPVSGKLFHRWQHVRSWSADSLGAYLNERGFEVIDSFATNFSVSFHTDHSKRPLRDKWRALKRKVKNCLKSGRKQPHLVAIARRSG